MRTSNPVWVPLTVYCHRKTARAALVSDDESEDNAVWVPLSQIKGDLTLGEQSGIEMAEWIAQREGFL
jgi:hypothetical protein